MKLWVVIGLSALNTIFLLIVLYKIYKFKKEIKLKMTEDERVLNEQLERQTAALGLVATGVGTLKTTITELKEEIRVLTENNPDLEDEIAKASTLADQAESIASGMAENLPPVDEQPGGETGDNTEEGDPNPNPAPDEEADQSGESSEEGESGNTPA